MLLIDAAAADVFALLFAISMLIRRCCCRLLIAPLRLLQLMPLLMARDSARRYVDAYGYYAGAPFAAAYVYALYAMLLALLRLLQALQRDTLF